MQMENKVSFRIDNVFLLMKRFSMCGWWNVEEVFLFMRYIEYEEIFLQCVFLVAGNMTWFVSIVICEVFLLSACTCIWELAWIRYEYYFCNRVVIEMM